MTIPHLAVLLTLFPLPAAALAASTAIKVGPDTYYLHTNSPYGSCRTRDVGQGTQETVCSDGGTVVAFSTSLGCLDSAGAGYCAKNDRHVQGLSGSQLNCPSGVSYWAHSGKWNDNNCVLQNGFRFCESSDGSNYAEADCEHGCRRSGGAGMCCKVGTTGCRPPLAAQPQNADVGSASD